MRVLVIDIGGSDVKVFPPSGKKPVEIPSGPDLTPNRLLPALRQVIAGWGYEVVSIGYPGRVRNGKALEDPPNLGHGWVGFNWKAVFKKPLKILNDAAMQALGSYRGGRMLFLGLGTGLGSALILDGVVHPTEIGDLPYRSNRSYADYLGKVGLERLGRTVWTRHVIIALRQLKTALQVDYIALGGGKARLVPNLPRGVLRGDNSKAFDGGVRVWKKSIGRNGLKLSFI